MKRVYVVGTADTKGEELAYLRALVIAAGADAITVDVGTRKPSTAADISAREVGGHHPDGAEATAGEERGAAVAAMGEAFRRFITTRDDIGGVVGIGGGGGTSIITAGMRELPVGLPKLMVSTLASGDVGPFVGVSDIAMMYSVTDIAGLNRISRAVLRNAANAIAGMTLATEAPPAETKPAIGLTMFGVTTTCVTQAVDLLKDDYDCLVFHATGAGGRAMEKLADSGMLTGVIDATTTEICDLLFGGVLSAGEDRLGAIARTGIPYVGSVGALDMVNFWAVDTVPERYRGRNLHRHNPNVTLMRTTAEENATMGAWLAERLNRCAGPVRFLIPEQGVSALDAPGQPFHDPAADAALFAALTRDFNQTETRRLIRLPLHINDPAFSAALVDNFRSIAA
jgi:uncharacterized protein (UPF0261 family)